MCERVIQEQARVKQRKRSRGTRSPKGWWTRWRTGEKTHQVIIGVRGTWQNKAQTKAHGPPQKQTKAQSKDKTQNEQQEATKSLCESRQRYWHNLRYQVITRETASTVHVQPIYHHVSKTLGEKKVKKKENGFVGLNCELAGEIKGTEDGQIRRRAKQ